MNGVNLLGSYSRVLHALPNCIYRLAGAGCPLFFFFFFFESYHNMSVCSADLLGKSHQIICVSLVSKVA